MKWAETAHRFVQECLRLEAQTYYVLIFCTRLRTNSAADALRGLPVGTVVVPLAGCEALLRPYNASKLISLALETQSGDNAGSEKAEPAARRHRSEPGHDFSQDV